MGIPRLPSLDSRKLQRHPPTSLTLTWGREEGVGEEDISVDVGRSLCKDESPRKKLTKGREGRCETRLKYDVIEFGETSDETFTRIRKLIKQPRIFYFL